MLARVRTMVLSRCASIAMSQPCRTTCHNCKCNSLIAYLASLERRFQLSVLRYHFCCLVICLLLLHATQYASQRVRCWAVRSCVFDIHARRIGPTMLHHGRKVLMVGNVTRSGLCSGVLWLVSSWLWRTCKFAILCCAVHFEGSYQPLYSPFLGCYPSKLLSTL